ncbi:MAG: hypothetical protein Q4D21_04870 [Phascolarctobacterium sp.]|nr:hypothetical protein [Phascolarctobacterium sp.]
MGPFKNIWWGIGITAAILYYQSKYRDEKIAREALERELEKYKKTHGGDVNLPTLWDGAVYRK